VTEASNGTASALVPCPRGALVIGDGAARDDVRLSLVIPTLNEAENLAPLVVALDRLFEPVFGQAFELIVVDDDSEDRTLELALDLCREHPRLRVLHRTEERDLGSAVLRGFQVARGDVLGVMDADLQHPPELNLELFARVEQGVDLAVASRHVSGGGVSDWSLSRRLISRGAQLLGLLLLPRVVSRLSDPMSGFFMVRRQAVSSVEFRPTGYKVLLELLARGHVRSIAEVGYVFRERSDGGSKVTLSTYRKYVTHLFRLRRSH
jgi:dolichol-phosphate mannosyltransferase